MVRLLFSGYRSVDLRKLLRLLKGSLGSIPPKYRLILFSSPPGC